MVCYLQRRGRAVSQPGHIAEGGNSTGLSAETADKEAQNNERSLCLSNGPRKKKRKKTQTTSTGRHAAAPLSHIFSQILRNPQTCSIDQIRMTPPQVTRERLGCSFDRQKTLSYNLFNQPFISVLLPSPTLSVSPLLSPSDDVNASGTDGCREHLITLTPCLCNRTQTRHTNTHTHTHTHIRSESKMLMKISSIIKVST